MKKFIPSILLFSLSSFAQVSQVEIKNFSFNYSDPHGEGLAEVFNYHQKDEGTQKVIVDKAGTDFHILLEGVENRELDFNNAPDLLVSANKIQLKDFNLLFSDNLSMSATGASFISPDKSMDLKSFKFNCSRINVGDLMDQVISGCIQKMSVRAGGISQNNEMTAIFKAMLESHDEFKDSVSVKNLDFKISSGKFELSAEIKAQISGTAKGSGSMKYDIATKVLTVKISEVKFGILNVTSKVFDELKKQQSEHFKVKEPYLYIDIK